eukprot:CAMPEP_0197435350 /NCGR_PEP_ID=MMETSP1175-20131217/2962_1 /TAXON_ID=1003142 /ORGANISM="Triceratium dubium, Strain CCMP147" /LENGTH=734 /DNA_ID=CAMNT_0042964375 /DNA_START=1 /DNA_END=2205 /DNA_ORIENTATION=+
MASSFGRADDQIGLFTEDDEQRERLEISPEEIVESQTDILGIKVIPNKTEREVVSALSLMNEELSKIPLDQKRSYLDAAENCPDEVNEEKRLAFLWREDFDAKLAAVRLVNYWEKRKELFAERCFLPLTLRTLDEEIPLISSGLHQLLGKDSNGRAILAIDASLRNKSKDSFEAVTRVIWYFFHCLIEDVETQKRGFVLLALCKHAQFNNFDPSLMSAFNEFERECFPIRIVSLHMCHPRPFFRAILPISKFALGRRMRARLCFHFGSDEEVMEKLSMYGIAPENVPAHSGGRLEHDHSKWMCDRLQIEEQRLQSSGSNLGLLAAAAFDPKEGELHHADKRARRSHSSTPREENLITLSSKGRQPPEEKLCPLLGQTQPFSSSITDSLAKITDRNQGVVDAVNCFLPNGLYLTKTAHMNGSGNVPSNEQLSPVQHLPTNYLDSISHVVGPGSSASVPNFPVCHQIRRGCGERSSATSNHNTGAVDPIAVQNLLGVLQAPSNESNVAKVASKLAHSSFVVSSDQEKAPFESNTHQSLQVGALVVPRNSQNLSQGLAPKQDQSTVLRATEFERPFGLPCPLYIPMDEMRTSSFQCLLRKQIEVFVADEELAKTTTRGRIKPIRAGQVGIRCRHCRGLPLGSAQQGAMYFPSSLVSMYQTGQKMSSAHFFSDKPCNKIPEDVLIEGKRFAHALKSRSIPRFFGGGKNYWAEAGKMLGLVDTEFGIRFVPHNAQQNQY